jgi:hypothetical protein
LHSLLLPSVFDSLVFPKLNFGPPNAPDMLVFKCGS